MEGDKIYIYTWENDFSDTPELSFVCTIKRENDRDGVFETENHPLNITFHKCWEYHSRCITSGGTALNYIWGRDKSKVVDQVKSELEETLEDEMQTLIDFEKALKGWKG